MKKSARVSGVSSRDTAWMQNARCIIGVFRDMAEGNRAFARWFYETVSLGCRSGRKEGRTDPAKMRERSERASSLSSGTEEGGGRGEDNPLYP